MAHSVAIAVSLLTVFAAQPSSAHDTGYGAGYGSGNGTGSGSSAPSATGAAAGSHADEFLPADRDLLVKVRLAGLWEMPAGKMAAQKGVNPRVREIGRMISQQHVQLNKLDVAAAAQVGVTLPNEPNADQQSWLAEMRQAQGAEFDRVFVNRLRAAHGKVFPVIGEVRAGTRNPVVRELAEQANGFVLMHLTLLESTGLVDYNALPPPPTPAPAPSGTTTAAWSGWKSSGSASSGSASSGSSSPGGSKPSGSAKDAAVLTIPTAASSSVSPLWLVPVAGVVLLLIVPLYRRRTVRRRTSFRYGPQHRDHPSHRLSTPMAPGPPSPPVGSPLGRRSTHVRH